MDEIPITGYADRFSLAPGEKINFKISSTSNDPYRAKLIRVISGDPNPEGPGFQGYIRRVGRQLIWGHMSECPQTIPSTPLGGLH